MLEVQGDAKTQRFIVHREVLAAASFLLLAAFCAFGAIAIAGSARESVASVTPGLAVALVFGLATLGLLALALRALRRESLVAQGGELWLESQVLGLRRSIKSFTRPITLELRRSWMWIDKEALTLGWELRLQNPAGRIWHRNLPTGALEDSELRALIRGFASATKIALIESEHCIDGPIDGSGDGPQHSPPCE